MRFRGVCSTGHNKRECIDRLFQVSTKAARLLRFGVKIAALADIHANLPALEAVLEDLERWRPDQVVVLGDIVNRGPRPAACLRLVEDRRAAGWAVIRGNHEDYVLHVSAAGEPAEPPVYDVHRHTRWTQRQLGSAIVQLQFPYHLRLEPVAGHGIVLAHGSMKGTRDGVYPDTSERDLAGKIDQDCALFLVGHTHRPLVRQLGKTTVVNVGSAGLPFDGDQRGCYARLQWQNGWKVRIRRLSYDIAAARKDFELAGFSQHAGPLTRLILDELDRASPCLAAWHNRYSQRVVNHELTMHQAVEAFRTS